MADIRVLYLKYAWERDPQNMARATLVLPEPLSPVDLIELVQEIETYNWQLIYALEAAPHSVSWQERTSATQWTGIVQLARKYGISIDIQVLRLIRSTLLLESMAARLHREIDYVEEYWKFKEYRAEQARRCVTEKILVRMDGIGTEQTVIRLDRMAHALEGMVFRTTHMLSLPSVNFNVLMSKWSFAIYMMFRFILDAPTELSPALEALANVYSGQGLLRERTQIALRRLALSRDPRFTDQREQIRVLYQASTALCAVGGYVQALTHLREAERLADAVRDLSQVISALNLQIQCFFGLDRWHEILQVEEKRMALEASYGKDRIGRICFQCGVSAYVHGWRGEMELAHSHRVEAYQMMADGWGHPCRCGRPP